MSAILKNNLNIDKTGWTLVKFDDVVAEGRETVKDFTAEDIQHVVGLEHIDTENIHLTRWESMAESTTFTKKFKKGDVLFGRRRAYLKKAAQAPFSGICSGDITVLRAKKGLLPELLPFLVCNDKFFDYAVKHSAGGLSPRVKFKDLANYEFLLPPKDQQAKLAELLWAMDEVVEKEMGVNNSLKICFSSNSKKHFNDDVSKFMTLSDCAEVIMGQSPPGESYNQKGNGIPLINGPTEFTERYPVKIQWTTNPSKFCNDKDILLCVRGSTTGRINISNDRYCIGRGVAAIRGKSIFETDFLEFALRYNVVEIMRLSSGSTFPNIDSNTLKSIKIPRVTDDVQKSIISCLKSLDFSIELNNQQIATSKSLQKSLINQIF